MSEVMSFGNIVNSLRAVRNDYNEHLKAVPQYEAFLLVQSSTQSVADKLQGVAPAMAAEVVEALEAAKAKFQQHLASVPEYRALLAIDKLINDVAADLGVHAVVPAPVEMQVETTTDMVVPPAELGQPAEEQQIAAQAEATVPSQPVEVVHSDLAAEIVPPAHVVAQTEVQQAETQPELTTAEALSELQGALQAAEEVPAVATVAEAATASIETATPLPEPTLGTAPASPDPVHAEGFGQEAEKAA